MLSKITVIGIMILLQNVLHAEEIKVLFDFEDEKSLKEWEVTEGGKLELTTDNATKGKKALKVSLPQAEYPGIKLKIPKGKYLDLSRYDYLKIDMFVVHEEGINFEIRIDDDKSNSDGEGAWVTWCSINKVAKPEKNEIEVDLTSLTTNDRGRVVNLDKFTNVVIFMLSKSSSEPQTIYIDNIRVIKE